MSVREREGEDDVEEYVPVHLRRLQRVKQFQEAKQQKTAAALDAPAPAANAHVAPSSSSAAAVASIDAVVAGPRSGKSLLDQAIALRETSAPVVDAMAAKMQEEEQEVLGAVTSFKPLLGHKDYANDVRYTETMQMTDWKPPAWTADIPAEAWDIVREKHRILIDSEDPVPPPLERFEDMKLPRWLVAALAARNIKNPSPIQIQGLPCALAGRDMIGIAYTGSGKTLVFALPLFLYALAEETLAPISSRTGPLGIIVCPSRELAEQSHQIICGWGEAGVKVSIILFENITLLNFYNYYYYYYF